MNILELKIPPPILVILTGFFMWINVKIFPINSNSTLPSWFGIIIFLLGFGITAFAALAFKRAKTTLSPTHPQNATLLITSGIFRFSRNPMYVGMTFVLIGWAVFLANIHSIWGPIFFILFLTRFQIIPEEKILTEKWGVLYINYCLQTRRWL